MNLNGRMGYKVFSGDNMQTFINYHQMSVIEKENEDYQPYEGTQKRFKTTCSNQDYNKCLYGTIHNSFMEKFGCTVPFIAGVKSEEICINETLATAALKEFS